MITNILEYLESSAKRTPHRAAFADEDKSCTFEELEEKSRRAGSVLAGKIRQGDPVPVLMEKGTDTIAAFMGVVQAGGFYVLLDSKQPKARLEQILETLGAEILISSGQYTKELEALKFQGEVLWIEELLEGEIQDGLLEAVRKRAKDTDPLYGIFTSGSTGIPKGVVVCHRSVIDFIEHFTETFHITQEDVIGNQAPWDFDVSVKDIYSGLKTGARVEIIPKRMFSFPTQLLDFLCERQVTTLVWAVSALCIITTLHGFEYRVPEKINKILFSGEAMPVKHLNIWRKYLPDAVYVNLYGPTEITCNCTYYVVDREFEPGETLPIGQAFPNERVFLLDEENREITAPGTEGEICVTGTALALGYYRNPEQTEKAFVQNPLNRCYPERMYRTGDLGYYNEEGLLCFSTRKDFQIKHMGHRIELGEIETAMEQVEEITRACCIFDQENKKIVAFYEGTIGKRELKKKMADRLPMYMLPNRFCPVEQMPLNKNGKIDRKKLAENH
ncbi:MAG: amino acid adenylation domain-containing protein [Clostridiales bacterium]|nr:amino acid adenylation domain-containing protein [Clostridiales bacterium]